MEAPVLPKKKPAVFHHPIGFDLYDGLAMDLHAMTYAEPLMKEIDRLRAESAKWQALAEANALVAECCQSRNERAARLGLTPNDLAKGRA